MKCCRRKNLWSAICFKIMTRYTCGFLPRILAFFPALWVLFPSICSFSYKRAYICAPKKAIYMVYKQTCVYGVTAGRRIRGIKIVPSAINHYMYDEAEKYLQFESSMAAMAVLISSKVWVLFITFAVMVVFGSPTMDLLESVDCLLRRL